MKKETIKKRFCAALAAIMAVLTTGCGKVIETQEKPAGTAKETTVGLLSSDIPESSQAEESSEEPAEESSKAEESSEPEESSQADDSSKDEAVLKPIEREKVEDLDTAYRNYCADMFRMSVFDDVKSGENVMVSPESIAYALAMLENGSGGKTLSETEDLFYGMDISSQNEMFSQMIAKANSSEEVYFNIADSVWVREGGLTLAPEYMSNVQNYLGSENFTDPFDSEAYIRMNSWISDKTDGMIPKALDESAIEDSTEVMLINAMCFEAEWEEEYKDTQIREEGMFTAFDGTQQQCALMNSEEDCYIEGNGVTGFAKMYKGGKYAFVGLLPDEGTTPLDYIADLDGKELEKLWNERIEDTTVSVSIPEFKADHNIQLKDTLKAMGMTEAFVPGKADISGLTVGDNDLYVSFILHNTHIEVDRKGTKAAAVTTASLNSGCAAIPYSVYLDRPFMYMIVDKENNIPIFIGVINTLE